MRTISVLDKAQKPGIASIDCPDGRFQHEMVSPRSDKSVVLDLASPLYYPSSRSKIYDRSPYGNHGTIIGAIWKQLPSGLPYLDYDGIDDCVKKSSPSFINDTQGTIKIWARLDALSDRAILSVSKDGATDDEFFPFYYHEDRAQPTLVISGALAWRAQTAAGLITQGKYHQWICTSDGSIFKLYIDGILKSLADMTGINAGQWFASATDADVFTIGGISRATLVADLDGGTALPLITRTIWSAEESLNSYNQEKHLLGV